MLTHIYKALKPGGQFSFTIPCAYSTEVAQCFSQSYPQRTLAKLLTKFYHPRRKFSAGEYYQLLVNAGFNEVIVDETSFIYYFELKENLLIGLQLFSPMLFYIPDSLHESFLKELSESYINLFQ